MAGGPGHAIIGPAGRPGHETRRGVVILSVEKQASFQVVRSREAHEVVVGGDGGWVGM
jgi:hypothetical protein